VDGTLGYADADQLTFGRQGTVTWLPAEGATIGRGGTAYRVDDERVPLLYGTLPPWRDLAVGVDDGRDVTQLEKNLAALGYDPGTVDDHFSSATRDALSAWQEDRGVEATGEFRRGDAAWAPGPIRVAEQAGTVGAAAAPGQPALKVTSTTREVSVDLEASKQTLVARGDAVQVTLPSGRTVRGRVREVSRVAKAADTGDQGGEGGEPTVEVRISLDDPKAAGALDQAPVDVAITTETSQDALAVPVHALLALAEGGYAVEVDEGGKRRLVPVELGLFADTLVEVTGPGLREGMRVVVPA
jgi:peptidoglycan hydrolase-like protein with peptidoglycan-binding domain